MKIILKSTSFILATLILASCSLLDERVEEQDIEEEIVLETRPARELDHIVEVLEQDDPNLDSDFDWVEPRDLWFYAEEDDSTEPVETRIRLPYYDGQSPLSHPSGVDYPEDGWVLMARDFGTENRSRKGLPFFALYNKETGVLRFMFLNIFAYEMTEARVTLGYVDPEKSGKLLHGMDERTNLPNHIEYDPYFEAARNTDFYKTGGWGITDFELQFDPDLDKETILDFNIFFVDKLETTRENEETGEIETTISEEVEKYQHIRLSVFEDTWLNDGTTYKNLYSGPMGI